MRITRETDYAIRAVLYLSEKSNKSISVTELHEKLDIPKTFLAKILQKLNRIGILESSRGVSGGFKLAKPPSKISLYDVVHAIQGEVIVNQCAVDGEICSRKEICSVHPVWRKIEAMIIRELKTVNFSTLAQNGYKNTVQALPNREV